MKNIEYFIFLALMAGVIYFIISLIVKRMTEGMKNVSEFHDSVAVETSILDNHPYRKFYLYAVKAFYIFLYLYLIGVLFGSFIRPYIPFFNLFVFFIAVFLFFSLLLVKCPRCKSSIFLQEFNTSLKNGIKVCLKCGFPKDDVPESVFKGVESVRKPYKWAFYFFFGIPIVLIIAKAVYRFFKEGNY